MHETHPSSLHVSRNWVVTQGCVTKKMTSYVCDGIPGLSMQQKQTTVPMESLGRLVVIRTYEVIDILPTLVLFDIILGEFTPL